MGWEKLRFHRQQASEFLVRGLSAVQIGERLHCSPEDAILDLLIDERLAVGLLGFGMSEEDVIEGIKHPSMCVITDGLLSGKKPHPRTYAAFPRFLARYVREKHILSLEEAVRKMTFNTARRLRMKHKGLILQGMDADIVVFDEQQNSGCELV